MFGFGTVTVSQAEDIVDDFIRLQKSIISDIEGEEGRLKSHKTRARQNIRAGLDGIVQTDNMKRYQQLSAVSSKAGVGDDFAKTVQRWTEEDRINREERVQLETDHGTRQTVQGQIDVVGENLNVTTSANTEVSDEIAQFDDTTQAIEAFNQQYPENPITKENHDDFEKFRLMQAVRRYTLGLVFNSHAAPHEAYKILGKYDKKYGDYYDDKLGIAKLRETQADIEGKQERLQKEFDRLSSIANRMDALDLTYKGPAKMAYLVRDNIYELLNAHHDFCRAFVDVLQTHEAAEVVASVAQLAGYEELDPKLDQLMAEAKETKSELEGPSYTLSRGRSMVPYEYINFDFDHIRSKFDAAKRDFDRSLNMLSESRNRVGSLDFTSFRDYNAIRHKINEIVNIKTDVPDRTFDLDALEYAVQHEIRQEEERRAEEERRRQEELARQRREAQEREDAAAEARRSRESNDLGDPFGSSRSSGSNNLGNPFDL